MKTFLLLTASVLTFTLQGQIGPEITSWKINTTAATGYGGILSNVQQVQYNVSDVYVSATCIPSYSIGPWPTNPNTPSNQNFVYKITRSPQQNLGTLVTTPLGHIGVWSNGVSAFNAKDGMSYLNLGVWNRNAEYYESVSFDNCLGHPAPNGEYHNHVNPKCVYNENDSLNHSPIIGYAFDGFPIYGAYAFTNTNGTGPIKRMKSSFTATTIATRISGPAVSVTYPVGCFIEDYAYSAGLGDLDIHNGRFCVTPEYPAGIYAYFITIDGALNPVYPFVIGPQYYGIVQAGNTGPGSGHNIPPGGVTTYAPATAGIQEGKVEISTMLFPNPASEYISLFISAVNQNNFEVSICDLTDKILMIQNYIQPTIEYTFDVSGLEQGIYFMRIKNDKVDATKKLVIQ